MADPPLPPFFPHPQVVLQRGFFLPAPFADLQPPQPAAPPPPHLPAFDFAQPLAADPLAVAAAQPPLQPAAPVPLFAPVAAPVTLPPLPPKPQHVIDAQRQEVVNPSDAWGRDHKFIR